MPKESPLRETNKPQLHIMSLGDVMKDFNNKNKENQKKPAIKIKSNGFKVGDILALKDPKKYKPSNHYFVEVKDIFAEKTYERGFMDPPGAATEIYNMTMTLISHDRPDAPEVSGHTKDFRKVTPAEIKARLKEVSDMKTFIASEKFKTGDMLVLNKDIEVPDRGRFGCGMITVRKGTTIIVDLAPDDTNDDDDMDDKRARKFVDPRDVNVGGIHLSMLVCPQLGVYFPEIEQKEFVSVQDVTRKTPDFKDTTLVVPDDYMQRLQIATRRVTDVETHEFVYKKLGLTRVCQKGRGSIILLYGPPGTGKTLTAEILAERINRPLIKLTLGSLTDGEGLAQRLAIGFKRAKRYNAILLLDEVDVFIRKRGSHNPMFDENTSVFLRVLEYFDGILVMTTNLVDHIDTAVFSRVHVCLEYGAQTEKERLAIWRSMFPPELMKVMAGNDETHEKMFNELAKIQLNGREIKTVIQNAVSKAVVSTETSRLKGIDAIPGEGAKWIHPKFFIEEAKLLEEQRNSLKGPDGPTV